ncbi:DUF2927 domain-containing protein [Marinibacterium profundimaris]|uniref:Lipoprotein n=1 Tax=Marinibacterium profundimaris TaxID=1679460 RepID=A0A225NG94_9RHOB|nr:DUF2927 domain-containing protein [Marinibacterium profundimaris]OWU72517.1 hypothetical protein ATO3_15675 [Marinibacterium profundimaris]
MRRGLWSLAAGSLALLLMACEEIPQPEPPARPEPVAPQASIRPQPTEQSDNSLRTVRYYGRRQADLETQGLLRIDGGGPDTPFDADALAANFEEIVFYDEYTGGVGPRRSPSGHLRRWDVPVRVDVEFGASVPSQQRRNDAAQIANFASRLGRITGHPVMRAQTDVNFHVLVMGEDDRTQLTRRMRELAPSMAEETLVFIREMPLTIECSVLAFSAPDNPYAYTKAIALIRAELPDLLRQSCVHEEIAQGLGPANDSPDARPSIFNDDDEFALLTNHDEMLLKMLYDPRLSIGMTAAEARPIVRIIARELTGQVL